MDDTPRTAIAKTGQAVKFDPLDPNANPIDISSLSSEQQSQLAMEYLHGHLDLRKKAEQIHVDVAGFKEMLDVMADKTRHLAAQNGTSVTMQHTHQSSVGKTEIVMGNTDQAAKGRLTRTMTGENNHTLLYVVTGAIALLILVSLLVRH